MIKKSLWLLIILIVGVFASFMLLGCEQPADGDDEDEKGLLYELEDNEYSVVGYYGLVTDVVIPNEYNGLPVTSISSDAFEKCKSLRSVTIGNSVIDIGAGAFEYCQNLMSVTLGSGITNIHYSSFFACDKLVEVYNLSEFEITKGSSDHGYVGLYALDIYTSLEEQSKLSTDSDGYVIHTDGAKKTLINYESGKTNLILPDGITDILQRIWIYDIKIASIVLPSTITNIDFTAPMNLISITIGENVQSIGEYIFSSCYRLVEVYNLSELDITKGSDDYGRVGMNALDVYTSLSEQSKLSTDSEGYVVYTDGADKALIGYTGNETNLIIPEGITAIHPFACFEWEYDEEASIYSIKLPSTVTTLTEGAFYGCWAEQIIVPTSLTSTNGYCGFRQLKDVFYCGTEEEWTSNSLDIYIILDGITRMPTVYFYSDTEPSDDGNYWHYDTDGVTPIKWNDSVYLNYN